MFKCTSFELKNKKSLSLTLLLNSQSSDGDQYVFGSQGQSQDTVPIVMVVNYQLTAPQETQD